MLKTKYPSASSISVSGGSTIKYANGDFTVGPSIGQIQIQAYAFAKPTLLTVDGEIAGEQYGTSDPNYDYWLGVRGLASVNAQALYGQKIKCTNNPSTPWEIIWIPKAGGLITLEGEIDSLLNSGVLTVDKKLVKYSALSAKAGPGQIAKWVDHIDAYGLLYSGAPFTPANPLIIGRADGCNQMVIDLGDWSFTCFVTSFTLNVDYPNPATMSASLTFDPYKIPNFVTIL